MRLSKRFCTFAKQSNAAPAAFSVIMISYKYILLTIASIACCGAASLIEAQVPLPASVDVEIPSFVDTKASRIEGSLPLFHKGLKRLEDGADTVLHIVHIGDSHIQAEFVTDRLRELLQQRYGNAGRGLMPALRLAGTNQSHQYEYTVGSDKRKKIEGAKQTRLLKFPWPVKPGFTGTAFSPATDIVIDMNVDGAPFDSLRIYTSNGIREQTFPTPVGTTSFPLAADEAFYGTFATNGRPGIIYSAIGNNGACFTDYSLIDGFCSDIAALRPDLIILSMGTNEGFSVMTDDEIRRSVRNLLRTLKNTNPNAEFLILAPMECQRNRRHGKKPLSPYYDINQRVKEAHDIIVEQSRALNVPLWDFYPVAGGYGASNRWLEAGLMNKDRIHLLRQGYIVEAQLLFNALLDNQ